MFCVTLIVIFSVLTFLNASLFTLTVVLDLMTIVSRLLAPVNASAPIDLRVFGKTTFSAFAALAKVLDSILVTAYFVPSTLTDPILTSVLFVFLTEVTVACPFVFVLTVAPEVEVAEPEETPAFSVETDGEEIVTSKSAEEEKLETEMLDVDGLFEDVEALINEPIAEPTVAVPVTDIAAEEEKLQQKAEDAGLYEDNEDEDDLFIEN